MLSKICLFVLACSNPFFGDFCAIKPDTLSVLAIKQYLNNSSEEFYLIITSPDLTEPQREQHQCCLIKELFSLEKVLYSHDQIAPLMQLNALSDSIQFRLERLFDNCAEKRVSEDYLLKYLVRPVVDYGFLTIYQIDRFYNNNPASESMFVYVFDY